MVFREFHWSPSNDAAHLAGRKDEHEKESYSGSSAAGCYAFSILISIVSG